jgi:DNA-directed RNA polymerase subunit RPC12/RpoP
MCINAVPYIMGDSEIHRCRRCGFEAPSDAEGWGSVHHPPLGELTQCPECGSTDTITLS